MLTAAALIAALIWRTHRRTFPADLTESAADLSGNRETKLFGPDMQIEIRPYVSGHPIGLVLAIVLLVILFVALPPARLFLLGAVPTGLLFAWILRRRHP